MTIGSMENVEVFNSEGKGRGLKATKEFWAADVIFAERAYAAVVFDSLVTVVCHTCFKRQEKLHRCGQCKFAHYCDRTCQKDAWLDHKKECSALKRHGKAPNENIRSGPADQEGCPGPWAAHSSHSPHPAKREAGDGRTPQVQSQYWKKQEITICQIKNSPRINCNGFTLSDQRGLQAVGVGIFPNLGLVNHDCWPNCTVIFNNGRIELRALGKISEGEELTVSYIDFLNVSEERRQQLKQQYYFDCTCEHCQKGLKDDLFLGVKEDPKPSQEAVKEMIQFSKDTLEKIHKARSEGLYHEVVRLCREALQKQEPVFADTNLYTLRLLSVISEVLSYLQAFDEASHYARRMVDGYMKLYHPNNAQLGMAVMRAGLTNWHAGHIEVGHGMICKAYAILLVTHGPSHPITKDLEAMRVQTEMELRMFRQNEFMYHKMREAALNNQPMQVMAEPSAEPAPALFHKKP
uniref:[histone H3]-lysine(4) N-trimethyltransferase n=1 Tax=Spermophilus dauricus TaxID=99837 RepID=A0A8C9PGB7_SPEDA